ncbi:hypothetical protein [Pelagicoccus sp. SDUM812003]|uniref:hypothetical protein n=1 Tax=Pelagicoccus sp. SDUM812003 TaxID=3041267 RepID=UPI00280EED36|nr:hypothetical protein [Pelagicoccus sp. SDUM812003]MDQ8204307.1 hypothetical protein [Pelagicoccus sp. SDUM812003]
MDKSRGAVVSEAPVSPAERSFQSEPSESDIRDYAYHLYEHSKETTDNDLDNWFEAKARLEARIPRERECGRMSSEPSEGTART